jgi:hypothetical protein
MLGNGLRRVRTRAHTLPLLGALLVSLIAMTIAVAPVAAAAGWTSPAQLGSITGCAELAAAIDQNGRQHLVGECGTNVRYLTNASGSWTTTTFSHPPDRFDLTPQIAIDGSTVYVAYTRVAPATCGYDYIGVYYRSRTLPNGAWSTTTRIGSSRDVLQGFRVVDGVFHLTVQDGRGLGQYETTASGSLKRYVLPGSWDLGSSSLRVGDDGAARVVYTTDGPIRYAIFHGSGFDWQNIPGTSVVDTEPQLVLDADNRAHVIWTHGGSVGCGSDEPPQPGTYYATNRTGQWTPAGSARRFTASIGPKSLTMDPVGGSVHVVVGLDNALKYYTKTASGSWSGVTISSHGAASAVIRRDPDSGRLFAAYVRLTPDFDLGAIYGLTKP